jgi:hypothetical protein
VWSSAILAELEFHEARKLTKRGAAPAAAEARASQLIQQMRRAFDDAEIHGWGSLDGRYGLPDSDDEHVVAAAVVGGANAIVTYNLKDFPPGQLPEKLEVLAPAEFLRIAVALDPRRALAAVEQRNLLACRGSQRLRTPTSKQICVPAPTDPGLAPLVSRRVRCGGLHRRAGWRLRGHGAQAVSGPLQSRRAASPRERMGSTPVRNAAGHQPAQRKDGRR